MPEELMVIIIVAMVLSYLLARTSLRQRGSLAARQRETEEVRLVQDLNRELERLEERVEALETILLERETRRQTASSDLT